MDSNSEDSKLSERDRAVLEQLKSAGSNLSLPHPIYHYLYFLDESSARNAGRIFQEQGFGVELKPPPASEPQKVFLLVVSHLAIPENEVLLAKTIYLMKKVAAAFKGDYDGWEAAIKK